MTIEYIESDMPFLFENEDEVFRIEGSKIYKSLGKNVKAVDFILHRNNRLRLIEAKSTVSKKENKTDFDDDIQPICEKFVHSLDLYFAIILERQKDEYNEVPEAMKNANIATAEILLLLVIKNHRAKWLLPISEELTRKLRRQIKTWNLKVKAINEITAQEWGLAK